MKELLPRERAFKVVCTNDRNEDQDLFGFYPSAKFASRAIPLLKEQYRDWIERCFGELIVKLPLWAVILIFIVAWHVSIIAVIVSLFFGVRYSFKGEADMSAANNVMGKASNVAEKVKEEYNKL